MRLDCVELTCRPCINIISTSATLVLAHGLSAWVCHACVCLQLVWSVEFIRHQEKLWDAGEVTEVHSLTQGEFNKSQFYLRAVGINFGILFIVIGPLLFLPACRGSLVNTFLGVHYGTAIKWHRCVPQLAMMRVQCTQGKSSRGEVCATGIIFIARH
jgi:hypothetical protein